MFGQISAKSEAYGYMCASPCARPTDWLYSNLMIISLKLKMIPAVTQNPPIQTVGPHVATLGMKFYTGTPPVICCMT